jgi:hypothetical protein
MNPIFDFISGLISPITHIVDNWQQRQTAQLQSDLKVNEAIVQAKIDRLKTAQEADISWENTAISNSGWKSGYLTILLSVPMILCFLPGYDIYVTHGFASLSTVPDWYKEAIGVMIAADFGYRKFADLMSLKKGV